MSGSPRGTARVLIEVAGHGRRSHRGARRAQVFGRFLTRAESATKAQVPGTGLGLLYREGRSSRAHGGPDRRREPIPAGGTTFVVELPAA